MSRHKHIHVCSRCGHSKIRCDAPPVDHESTWSACEWEAELERDSKAPVCDDCLDDVVATIRRGRTR